MIWTSDLHPAAERARRQVLRNRYHHAQRQRREAENAATLEALSLGHSFAHIIENLRGVRLAFAVPPESDPWFKESS